MKSALVISNLEGKAISGCFRNNGLNLFFLVNKRNRINNEPLLLLLLALTNHSHSFS